MFQMLAKEVIEDSLLSFVTQDAPDIEVDGEPMSQKVPTPHVAKCTLLVVIVIPTQFFFLGVGNVKDKGWTLITSSAS